MYGPRIAPSPARPPVLVAVSFLCVWQRVAPAAQYQCARLFASKTRWRCQPSPAVTTLSQKPPWSTNVRHTRPKMQNKQPTNTNEKKTRHQQPRSNPQTPTADRRPPLAARRSAPTLAFLGDSRRRWASSPLRLRLPFWSSLGCGAAGPVLQSVWAGRCCWPFVAILAIGSIDQPFHQALRLVGWDGRA